MLAVRELPTQTYPWHGAGPGGTHAGMLVARAAVRRTWPGLSVFLSTRVAGAGASVGGSAARAASPFGPKGNPLSADFVHHQLPSQLEGAIPFG